MKQHFYEFAATLPGIETTSSVLSEMFRLSEIYEFPFCSLTIATSTPQLHSRRFETNLPNAFKHRYCQKNLVEVDPFLEFKCTHLAASTLSTTPSKFPETSTLQKEFLEHTRDLGVASALAVPVRTRDQHEFGGWIIGNMEELDTVEKLYMSFGAELQLAALLAYEWIVALQQHERKSKSKLSPRERECLSWLSLGLRVAAIADKLKISESAVNLYITNARIKLDAKTREQAVARAILNGDICL